MDPWSGLGVGYEILSTSQTAQGITVSALPEFFARPVLERFFCDLSADIDKTALHEWLTVGVKGTFGL